MGMVAQEFVPNKPEGETSVHLKRKKNTKSCNDYGVQ